MNLKELKARGAFVASKPVTKNVKWKTPAGEEVDFDVFIKRLSFGTIEQIFIKDEDEESKSVNYIAKAVMFSDEKGNPVPITYQDAFNLDRSLASVLLTALNEVNGTGQPEKN